jgi:hypothetical protein
MLRRIAACAALALLCAASADAQVGRPLPPASVEGFTQTQARSLDDLVGRAVLIEFFAYW